MESEATLVLAMDLDSATQPMSFPETSSLLATGPPVDQPSTDQVAELPDYK